MSAAFVRKLAEAGMDAMSIAVALEAYEAAEEVRKQGARERKRRQREREKEPSESVTMRDVTRQAVTGRDTPAPSLSPQTPLTHPHPRECITTRARDAEFERFWEAYPLKVSKKSAAKAFPKALGKTDVETLVAAVSRCRTSRSWLEGFIPHAATWLNGERWLDEPDAGGCEGAAGRKLANGSRSGAASMADVLARRRAANGT